MHHFMLFFLCIIFVEFFIYFSIIKRVSDLTNNFFKVLSYVKSKRISDHWKEIIIPYKSLHLFFESLKLFIKFLILLLLFLVISNNTDSFDKLFFSIFGIIESIIFCYFYFKLREFISKN